MYSHLSHDIASRVASSARRSVNEHCCPSVGHRAGDHGKVFGSAAAQDVANAAMHHQIRIAADRRSEVRVLRQRETEVTDVLRLIDGLRHRAHDDRLDQVRFLVRRSPAAAPRSGPSAQVAIRRQLNAESAAGTAAAVSSRSASGCAVHAIQRRNVVLLEEARRLDVRGDHAFLDQAMRIVARLLDERCDAPVGVEVHLQLRRIEIQCAALQRAHACSALIDGVQMRQLRARPPCTCGSCRAAGFARYAATFV